ncbi:MAG: type II secretion system minor pseudopilin GspI [Saccharospirillum sp.]
MRKSDAGFTLIEVMVALAIFAVMAGAVALANTQNLMAAQMIREQSEARWVNQNVLTELRLESLPPPGTRRVAHAFNGQNWRVEVDVSAVDMPVLGSSLRRIELRAYSDESDQAADVLVSVLGAAG